MRGYNTRQLCSTNSCEGEAWHQNMQEFHLIAAIFAVFMGGLRGTATLGVALSMRPQSLLPCHFVLCAVVSPKHLPSFAQGFLCSNSRVYLQLPAKQCGYMQEQAPELLSLPKRMWSSACDNFKHFLLWYQVSVQQFFLYQEIEKLVGHLQNLSAFQSVSSIPVLALELRKTITLNALCVCGKMYAFDVFIPEVVTGINMLRSIQLESYRSYKY